MTSHTKSYFKALLMALVTV